MFVNVRQFYPCLIFVSPGSEGFNGVPRPLKKKEQSALDVFDLNKHSSLLFKSVKYSCKVLQH